VHAKNKDLPLPKFDNPINVSEHELAGGERERGEKPALLSRLDRLGEMTDSPATAAYLSRPSDTTALRELAARSALLARGSEAAFHELEARHWCSIVDGWLDAGQKAEGTSRIIEGLIAEAPAPHPLVRERLECLAGFEHIDEQARRCAKTKLEAHVGAS